MTCKTYSFIHMSKLMVLFISVLFLQPLAEARPTKECAALIVAAKHGQSAYQLSRQAKTLRLNTMTNAQKKECGKEMQKIRGVMTKLNRYTKTSNRRQSITTTIKKSSSNKYSIRASRLKSNVSQRLRNIQSSSRLSATAKVGRLTLKSKKINRITPDTIIPGIDIIVEGSGFGSRTGGAKLYASGKVYVLNVKGWRNEWIHLSVPGDISGVLGSRSAEIELSLTNGSTMSKRQIEFIPKLYEQKIPAELIIGGHTAPYHVSTVVFKGAHLNRGWKITKFNFTNSPGNECYITPAIIGGTNPQYVFGANTGWFSDPVTCRVEFASEGPVGIDSGLESFINSSTTL